MPFTDRAQIHVRGGDGGDGAMSFRREAHTPRGGPDGGNGGRGGDVSLIADREMRDLSVFRHAVHHRAESGGAGAGRRRHGPSGPEMVIAVPVGTRVIRDDAVIAELDRDGAGVRVAAGGEGGVGNHAFRSSTNRAPRRTIPGGAGEEAWLTLEYRPVWDVVLVGLPNSGKSALLVALTGAAAVVAPYPQSTREPAFGPLEDDLANLFTVVDLPGVGDGGGPRPDGHLMQLENARLILHCVDASDPRPAAERIAGVERTLRDHAADRPVLVVATHAGDADRPDWADLAVDSVDGTGVGELRAAILGRLGSA